MPTLPGEGDDLENRLIQKGGRGGRTGGGTGVGPGGGFGGAFGGGGSGFLAGGGGSLGGDLWGGPMKKRFVMGANGEIPLSYTPMKSQDSVPAMLSPGEYVLNNRSMQIPGAQEFAAALNAAGNGGHYAEGGPVGAGGGLTLDADTFKLLLQLLARFTGSETGNMSQEGENDDMMGGHVAGGNMQHFAWGGMVRPQQGGFSAPQMGRAAPQMGGMAPSAGRQSFAQMGASSGLSTAPTMQPLVNRQMGGRPAPSPTPTATPTPNATTAETYNTGIADLNNLLKQFTDAGYFSPEGNQALMRAVQANATSNADAMRARQQNALSLGGMDPGQAAAFKQMADLRGQGDVANALNSAQYGALQNQQNFANNLFNTMGQFNLNDWQSYLDFVRASRLKG